MWSIGFAMIVPAFGAIMACSVERRMSPGRMPVKSENPFLPGLGD